MSVLNAVLAFPVGLVVGSVVTMLVDRVPDRQPLLRPGPRCPYCNEPIAARHLVPVASWFALRGRCHDCGHRITPAYPVVELVTGGLFAAAAVVFDDLWVLVPYLVLFTSLVAVSVIDLYLYRIPNRIVFPTLAISAALMLAASLRFDTPELMLRALLGMALYGGTLLVFHLLMPRGMGFGDVKLALVLGLFLGWLRLDYIDGVRLVLFALIAGSILGTVGGFAAVFLRGRGAATVGLDDPDHDGDMATVPMMKQSFPFGPALAAGTILVVLFADQLVPVA